MIRVVWFSVLSGAAATAMAQSGGARLTLVFDDLAPKSAPGAHSATAVGFDCTRPCDCPAPYPCEGPCPSACTPPCFRSAGGVYSRGELARLGPETGETVLEPGFAQTSDATATLVVGPGGGSPDGRALLTLVDAGGDSITIDADGDWWFGAGSGAYTGRVRSVAFHDAPPLDGIFDGTAPGGVALSPLGCSVLGTLQYVYTGESLGCARGTVLVDVLGQSAACAADVDCSGAVDGEDLVAFFAAWDAGGGDFTGDGVTDGDDVIAFMSLWDSGC